MRMPAVLSFLAFSASLAAQHGSSPAVTLDQTSEGARLFRAQCAGCHSPDGSGTGAGPALNSGTFRRGSSDDAIVATISKGVPGTTMPAFSFDANQMWRLLAFVRSLNLVRAASDTPGDRKAGETIFRASCAGCHTPSGAFTGPDLARSAARLTVTELRQSVLDPNAAVLPEYWSIAGRTGSGKEIAGIRLNEDTSSIQLRERGGRLVSVLKSDLASFEIVRTSPMPSFKGKLSDTQITDVIAYLVKGNQ